MRDINSCVIIKRRHSESKPVVSFTDYEKLMKTFSVNYRGDITISIHDFVYQLVSTPVYKMVFTKNMVSSLKKGSYVMYTYDRWTDNSFSSIGSVTRELPVVEPAVLSKSGNGFYNYTEKGSMKETTIEYTLGIIPGYTGSWENVFSSLGVWSILDKINGEYFNVKAEKGPVVSGISSVAKVTITPLYEIDGDTIEFYLT